MTILGITGPTGAGKTTLLREVGALGGAVIDCDAVYHEMLEQDAALRSELEAAFGPLRDGSGRIDRKRLGAVVFSDPDKLELLNNIAWTAVADQVRILLADCERQGKQLAAVDAIALLEGSIKELCQLKIAVLAPQEVRVRRIMAREGISREYAWARAKAQKPDGYFMENCDYVLVNDCETAEEFAQKAQEFLEPIYTQSL